MANWLALRLIEPNINLKQAATKLGVKENTLSQYIRRAAKEGWLKFDDTLDRLDYQIVPKILDGYETLLDEGDKTAIIEGMKGTAFKVFQEAKGIKEAPQTILVLKVEYPSGETKAISGTIVGRPKYQKQDEDEDA